MSKAVVIGYRDDILPFAVWGMKLLPIASSHELFRALDEALQDTTLTLIFISEAVVKDSLDAFYSYMASQPKAHIPVIILPTHRGSYGTSLRETANVIKKAVGIDILEGA